MIFQNNILVQHCELKFLPFFPFQTCEQGKKKEKTTKKREKGSFFNKKWKNRKEERTKNIKTSEKRENEYS